MGDNKAINIKIKQQIMPFLCRINVFVFNCLPACLSFQDVELRMAGGMGTNLVDFARFISRFPPPPTTPPNPELVHGYLSVVIFILSVFLSSVGGWWSWLVGGASYSSVYYSWKRCKPQRYVVG